MEMEKLTGIVNGQGCLWFCRETPACSEIPRICQHLQGFVLLVIFYFCNFIG